MKLLLRIHDEGRKRYLSSDSDIRSLLSKSDRAYNIDSWGRDKNHNLLAITGVSGSGKSTLATTISDAEGADKIGLDNYYENPYDLNGHSTGFDTYLKKHVPQYFKDIVDNFDEYESARFDSNDQKGSYYWNTMDRVRDAMFDYARERYGKQKVIAEGVQWLDTTMYTNSSSKSDAMKGMPLVVRSPGAVKSTIRRLNRDREKYSVDMLSNIINNQMTWNRQVKDMDTMMREGDLIQND